MSGDADERLQRLLGGDALADLRRRLRRHFERADPAAPSGTIRLGNVLAHEYEALARLVGRRPRQASSIQVDVAEIDASLSRAEVAPSLKAALDRLDGPIEHLPTVRAETAARWAAVGGGARHPGLAPFLQSPTGLGLLKRLARQDAETAARLRDRAESVLQRLPAPGQPRAQLAAEVLGDAHALDNGAPAATLVLAVLKQAVPPAEGDAAADAAEEDSRTLWARAGVLVNELARPVLFLNLPLEGGGCFAGEAGEPGYAALRQLLRTPPRAAVMGRAVYVCENPNLIAIAADQLGPHCAPLVCTEGMPAAAQRTLLALLAQAGAHFFYHGDFDWPGIRIANVVMRDFNARPWRFGTADYTEAAGMAAGEILTGATVAAAWDAALAQAMAERGLAIPEEGVAGLLLEDLEE
ncbi:MAG TPA: TIGR02679 family protein [Hyphomicrobiaceae bacterium]|jgi:uncharacterized protein (TIGR02679 family)